MGLEQNEASDLKYRSDTYKSELILYIQGQGIVLL
jgi:hypothetical protein